MAYQAPVADILRTLLAVTPEGALEAELSEMILTEAGKVASERLAVVNQAGDRQGARLEADGVRAPDGYETAYPAIQEGGWVGLAYPEEVGGQGLPRVLALAVMEMFHGANASLALCPMLSLGAIEALLVHGSEEQKRLYLPKLVTGEWSGTMNLTEPQAGSDVGALTMKAVPNGDGSYALTGQKIFITWGEHDLTENIVQLVLARLPDAPPGSKGVSLFVCTRRLLDEDGNVGEPNRMKCIGLETKTGIHGSPTCVIEFNGAKAWLVGEPNRGMAAMFTMMNSARVNVGIQGVGIADAACQEAFAYARERRQGQAQGVEGSAPIVRHPDVQQMLASMRSKALAARAICYACGAAADVAETGADEAERAVAKVRENLLTPIAKAWSTDVGVEVANLGVQVHGGMGFMSETLASQLNRDARIGPIYEGTNGIQAIDLVGRKVAGDGGAGMRALIAEIDADAERARASNDAVLASAGRRLELGARALEAATAWIVEAYGAERSRALSVATRYLKLAGNVVGGGYLVRIALKAAESEDPAAEEMAALAAVHATVELAGVSDIVAVFEEASAVASTLERSMVA